MEIVVNNLTLKIYEKEDVLKDKLSSFLSIDKKYIESYKIVKKALDARKKNSLLYVYSLRVILNKDFDFSNNKNVKLYDSKKDEYIIPLLKSNSRPIVVGLGPCGLMSAYYLANAGLKPIVIEMGKDVDSRIKDVESFKNEGVFNPKSNVCFGEGGAGTFSDGKLMTGIKDDRIRFILDTLIEYGAPKEIGYLAHPHIGSDNLRNVVKNIRNKIISLGGEVYFEHKFIDFDTIDDHVNKVRVLDLKTNEIKEFITDDLILAIGHSSRDTFKLLLDKKVNINPKPFSIGVRLEMLQKEVNIAQYGKDNLKYDLPPAEYKIVTHLPNGRGVYSFCMCPGGEVVASNTEENSILVNGMSYFKRDLENANSAILVSVNVEDYYKGNPLDGMYFQESIEKKAFNKDYPYFAPIQLVGDFIKGKKSTHIGKVIPSYKPGYYFASLDEILPSFIAESLKMGLISLGNKLTSIKNEDNILTGVETRSSSPIHILRDEFGQTNIRGIYPCGEGASYAGGITSSMVDGLRVGEFIKNKYQGGN